MIPVQMLNYLVISPQYQSASCREQTGGERQLLLLLFAVDIAGFVDRGGRAMHKGNKK